MISTLKECFTWKFIRQFFSYFVVGGSAAVVEWISFGVFHYGVHISHMWATVGAFFFSTTFNWFLGRILTFQEESKKLSPVAEFLQIFLVSGVGLGFNLGLMYIFVDILGWISIVSKILATGIVFFWNFAIRKFVIYRIS